MPLRRGPRRAECGGRGCWHAVVVTKIDCFIDGRRPKIDQSTDYLADAYGSGIDLGALAAALWLPGGAEAARSAPAPDSFASCCGAGPPHGAPPGMTRTR